MTKKFLALILSLATLVSSVGVLNVFAADEEKRSQAEAAKPQATAATAESQHRVVDPQFQCYPIICQYVLEGKLCDYCDKFGNHLLHLDPNIAPPAKKLISRYDFVEIYIPKDPTLRPNMLVGNISLRSYNDILERILKDNVMLSCEDARDVGCIYFFKRFNIKDTEPYIRLKCMILNKPHLVGYSQPGETFPRCDDDPKYARFGDIGAWEYALAFGFERKGIWWRKLLNS